MAHLAGPPPTPELLRTDDLPVGANLAWRVQTLIQSGKLPSRARLPGVRELAAGAGVNTNTARSVYRRLENEGLAVSRHGSGTFVAPYATVSPTLEQFAAQVASDAIAQGIDTRELARALYAGSSPSDTLEDLLDEAPARDPEDERSARVSLRAQIARLEASLAPYPEGKPEDPTSRRLGRRPRVASLDELEKIRDELVGRLKAARHAAERRADDQHYERRRLEAAAADPAAHRWEAGTSPDHGEPGCGRWQVAPAWGPVGALMNWWRVKISSGCP